MTSLINAALARATQGIPVFPLRANKRPCQKGGFKTASTDPIEVARMFADPLAVLIGIPCGPPSGFDAIDIDVKRDGLLWLAEHEHELPVTERHVTRSGGAHLLLRHSPGMRTMFDAVANGVEIRGDGGYIVDWPSHGGRTINCGVIAEWPDWLLLAALRNRRKETATRTDYANLAAPSPAMLIRLLQSMPNPESATRGDYTAVNLAVQGCARALESLGRLGGDDPDGIKDAAADWSSRWDHPNASDYDTERAKWESDWSTRDNDVSGWRHLLNLAKNLGADVSEFSATTAFAEFGELPPVSEQVATPTPAPAVEPKRAADIGANIAEPTETAVADGFAADMRGRVIFDHSAGKWHAFDGAVWRQDETAAGLRVVLDYVRHARALFGDTDKAMAGISFARNVDALARTHPGMSATAESWDRDPFVLGVPGGVVDLRTGARETGRPDLMIKRQAGAAPTDSAPVLWLSFLRAATNDDADFIAYLQRLAGYCLTGDISEEALHFFYGAAGNGKGTFLQVLAWLLGEYAYAAPAGLGDANSKINPEYQLAFFPGRRAVFMSELPQGVPLNEPLVKQLSGNEGKINARHPAGRPFEFDMQAKVILVSNYEPRLRGRSESLERRLRVLPFNHKPTTPDGTLKARLRVELPAIMRWAIDGCLEWQKYGLGTCAAIAAASGSYFEDQDVFSRWAAERVEHGAGLRVPRTDLLADYTVWARTSGEARLTSTEFYEMTRRQLGALDKKSNGIRYLEGVGLRAAVAEFPDVPPESPPAVAPEDLRGFLN